MFKKIFVVMSFFIFLVFMTSFGHINYKFSSVSENFDKDTKIYTPSTPEYSIQASLKALKDLDLKTFNIYTDNVKDYDDENNILFENEIDEESRKFFESLFRKIDFEVKDIQIDGDTAIVNTDIINTDLTGVIDEFTLKIMEECNESENLNISNKYYFDKLAASIDERVGETKVENLDLLLKKDNDIWILHIDKDFINASCGGILKEFDLSDKKDE